MTATLVAVTMRDAAWPSSLEPSELAELVYVGGDTPNPLALSTSPARYRVPCWVRSDPTAVSATVDARAMVAILQAAGVPQGSVTILDLETAVNVAWVTLYASVLHANRYLVWPYGSTSTLFQNPEVDGWFASDPVGVDHMYPGCVATQWGYFGAYDLSTITAGQPLWDRNPVAPPPPPPAPLTVVQGDSMILVDPVTGGTWCVASQQGAVDAVGGAPYLGGTNNTAMNAAKYPCVGIGLRPNQDGYRLVLDWGNNPGDRFRTYNFPRNGSGAVTSGTY